MPTTITGDTGASQIQAGATSSGLPVFQCRAWVNFDGTRDTTGALSTANTNRFIRASGNVASVLRNGTGDYTITFTTPMPDANYAVSAITGNSAASGFVRTPVSSGYVAGSMRIENLSTSVLNQDSAAINVAIFR